MTEQVEVVALKERDDRLKLVLAAGLAVSAEENTVRTGTDARAGLLRETAVAGEQKVAGVRRSRGHTVADSGSARGSRRLLDVDDAVAVDRGRADVAHKDRVGIAVAVLRKAGRVDVDRCEGVVLAEERNVREEHSLLLRIFAVDREVGAAVEEVLPGHARNIEVLAEPSLGGCATRTELDAGEVTAEDEVDHARDGVRTVDGRIAPGDDVDPLDQVVRDRVDVGRNGVVQDVGGNVTTSVDQHQGARRAETAKVEQVETGDADARARVGLVKGRAKLGKLVQRVADVAVALLKEAFADDRGDRNGRFEVGTTDARSGDDHFLAAAGRSLGGGRVGAAVGRGRGFDAGSGRDVISWVLRVARGLLRCLSGGIDGRLGSLSGGGECERGSGPDEQGRTKRGGAQQRHLSHEESLCGAK